MPYTPARGAALPAAPPLDWGIVPRYCSLPHTVVLFPACSSALDCPRRHVARVRRRAPPPPPQVVPSQGPPAIRARAPIRVSSASVHLLSLPATWLRAASQR